MSDEEFEKAVEADYVLNREKPFELGISFAKRFANFGRAYGQREVLESSECKELKGAISELSNLNFLVKRSNGNNPNLLYDLSDAHIRLEKVLDAFNKRFGGKG